MASGTTTPLSERHKILLGKDPTSVQQQLYSRYPEARGFSDRALDSEKLEAAVVSALTTGKATDRVLLLAPVHHEVWVLDGINEVAARMFERCKLQRDPALFAKGLGTLFQKLLVAGRLLQLPSEPPHWISFGFATEDPLPEWMAGRLIDQSSSLIK
jgi:hypothetical protein